MLFTMYLMDQAGHRGDARAAFKASLTDTLVRADCAGVGVCKSENAGAFHE